MTRDDARHVQTVLRYLVFRDPSDEEAARASATTLANQSHPIVGKKFTRVTAEQVRDLWPVLTGEAPPGTVDSSDEPHDDGGDEARGDNFAEPHIEQE